MDTQPSLQTQDRAGVRCGCALTSVASRAMEQGKAAIEPRVWGEVRCIM
jgi:hypothetical protein